MSNTEIGPAASSNWKSGNIRTPIMVSPMSENEGSMPFQTSEHHARLDTSSRTSKRPRHAGSAADWNSDFSESDPARLHRPVAGVLEFARCCGASDLETDRAGRKRLGNDAHADHHLCRLPAARRDLRSRRHRHRRYGQ